MFAPGMLNDSSKTGYGFGWFVEPYRDKALIAHDGGFRTGYNSVMNIYPEDHVGIIILTNLHRAHVYQIAKDIVGLFNPDYARASLMDSVADPDTVRTLLLKSSYEELGLTIDSLRKMARELHMLFYPQNEDLAAFRNITEFRFIKAFKFPKPQTDIFGDPVQGIYLYKVRTKDLPDPLYLAFYLDPTGKLVFINFEE